VQQTPHPRKPHPYSGAVEHCTFYPSRTTYANTDH